MVMHFGENLDASIKYANSAFKGFGGWFVLILLNICMFAGVAILCIGTVFMIMGILTQTYTLPEATLEQLTGMPAVSGLMFAGFGVVGFITGLILTILFGTIVAGVQVRAYRGGEMNFANFGRLIRDGFLAMIIMCIYTLPYTIIATLAALGPVNNPVYLWIVCIAIPVIILIISILIGMIALVHFAKNETFGSAFHLKEICGIISDIGWLRLFGYICLLSLLIGAVEMVLCMVPIVGLLLFIVVIGFIQLAQARFIGNLYETASE